MMLLCGILFEMFLFEFVCMLLLTPLLCIVFDANVIAGVNAVLLDDLSFDSRAVDSSSTFSWDWGSVDEHVSSITAKPASSKRNVEELDPSLDPWIFPYNSSHLFTNISVAEVFANEAACDIQHEAPIGSKYVSGGHPWKVLSEPGRGCPMVVNIRIIDAETCKNASDVYVEVWHANATGAYTGLIEDTRATDKSNLNNTMFLGLRNAGSDGMVQFITTVPGHHVGRTTHISFLVHPKDATMLENQTISNIPDAKHRLKAIHVGEIFFDQEFLDYVANMGPYHKNTQPVTRNEDDEVFKALSEEGDPVLKYMWIDPLDTARLGIFAWVTVGVDMSRLVEVDVAGRFTEGGGVQFEGDDEGEDEVTSTSAESTTSTSDDSSISTSVGSAAPTSTIDSGASKLAGWPFQLR